MRRAAALRLAAGGLRRDLAPGGRVAVVDYDGRKFGYLRRIARATPRAVLVREMAESG